MQLFRSVSAFSTIPSYFTLDPKQLSSNNPHKAQNFLNGKWIESDNYVPYPDPLNGETFVLAPEVNDKFDLNKFVAAAKTCPRYGLHNPLWNPERYQLYGEVCHKIAAEMKKPEVNDFLTTLIQRVMPKHRIQAQGEVTVTERFFQNFSGDQPRFLARSFNVAGDRPGQQSTGYRWPYGPVAIISPFNFPLEIPSLQIFGALMTGNKVFFKGDSRVNVVMEQMLRLALHCGLPEEDINMLFADGKSTEYVLRQANFRNTQFTGSSKVAEKLATVLRGKIKIEDAGFDWKILGPDTPAPYILNYVAWQSDQDAYACSGQKCSAQSILFVHQKWAQAGLYEQLKNLAEKRNIDDLSVGPLLSVTDQQIYDHINQLIVKTDATVVFGGKKLPRGNVPPQYGLFQPTAINVPIWQIKDNLELVTKEIFGPFQILVTYNEIDQVLEIINSFESNLTAGIVSNNVNFLRYVEAQTINGVTYSGLRARTTGAPQNHWFGPCGDPRGAGIGSPEAILSVWTTHREVIRDTAYPPKEFTQGIQS